MNRNKTMQDLFWSSKDFRIHARFGNTLRAIVAWELMQCQDPKGSAFGKNEINRVEAVDKYCYCIDLRVAKIGSAYYQWQTHWHARITPLFNHAISLGCVVCALKNPEVNERVIRTVTDYTTVAYLKTPCDYARDDGEGRTFQLQGAAQ